MSIAPEAAWGLFGALCYAAQNYSACLYAHRAERGHWRWCTADFVIAVGVGTVGAAAFTPWAAEWLGATGSNRVPAIAVLIGLLANAIKPILLDRAPRLILRQFQIKDPPA